MYCSIKPRKPVPKEPPLSVMSAVVFTMVKLPSTAVAMKPEPGVTVFSTYMRVVTFRMSVMFGPMSLPMTPGLSAWYAFANMIL